MKLSLAIVLLAGTVTWAADPVPMDVKTGEWEYTVTTQITGLTGNTKGMPQLTPDQLAKLPPEARAKLEAVMKGQPQTRTSKTCVKKDDASMNVVQSMDKSCKVTFVSSSSRKQEMKMNCDDGQGMKQTGSVLIESSSSDTVKFTIDSSGTSNGQQTGFKANGTGKWLSSTCTEK